MFLVQCCGVSSLNNYCWVREVSYRKSENGESLPIILVFRAQGHRLIKACCATLRCRIGAHAYFSASDDEDRQLRQLILISAETDPWNIKLTLFCEAYPISLSPDWDGNGRSLFVELCARACTVPSLSLLVAEDPCGIISSFQYIDEDEVIICTSDEDVVRFLSKKLMAKGRGDHREWRLHVTLHSEAHQQYIQNRGVEGVTRASIQSKAPVPAPVTAPAPSPAPTPTETSAPALIPSPILDPDYQNALELYRRFLSSDRNIKDRIEMLLPAVHVETVSASPVEGGPNDPSEEPAAGVVVVASEFAPSSVLTQGSSPENVLRSATDTSVCGDAQWPQASQEGKQHNA